MKTELTPEYRRGANDALNKLVEFVPGDYGQNIAREIEVALGLYEAEEEEIANA